MAVSIKSAREIELMREAGKRLAHVHQELEAMIAPGISTWEIDAKGEKLIRDCGCIPNFLHYNGYPASICVSVNDEVVHGIPRKDRYLKEGDIVSLDAGLIYKGYHSDAANKLTLWSAVVPQGFDMAAFSRGDYARALEQNTMAETISKVLYPADDHIEGKRLRLKQQYLLVSASPRSTKVSTSQPSRASPSGSTRTFSATRRF